MTNPVAPQLLSPNDLTSFQQSDPAWFFEAAGEVIRTACQWHIAPSITVTDTVTIQPDGTIMLPSLYVTGVSFMAINGVEIDPSTYQWHQAGYITWYPTRGGGVPSGYPGGFSEWSLWPLQSDTPFNAYPSPVGQHADVTYTHGYPTLPEVVKAVGFQLAQRAMEMPTGIATDLTAGPYSIKLAKLGLVLSDDERRLLGPYTLIRF
jgi:hypothetical protein